MKFYFRSELEITHYNFHSKKVRRDVRLAVLADLHNCMWEDGGRQLFNVIDGEHPDVIVIAGDMVDGKRRSDPSRAMRVIGLLNRHYPVIYGMGNHERKLIESKELICERKIFRKELEKTGLKILSNSYKYLDDTGVKLSCFDLPLDYFKRFVSLKLSAGQIESSLGELDSRYFNVMIAHDPQYFKAYSDYGPELILSGHMHGGVIRIPHLGGLVSPKLKLFPEYDAGLYERKGSSMIVSKGLGMHSIPVRINDPTELVIVDIYGK